MATSWQPAAVASACTLATTGWGIAWTVSIISVHTSNSRRASARSAPTMSPKLCPAENTGPFAARMTPSASLSPDLGEGRGELAHHVERQRVALLGPVEGDRRDVALLLDEQVLVGHAVSLVLRRSARNVTPRRSLG